MEVRELETATAFLAVASPLLLADEARHNLILGICGTLVDTPDAYRAFHLWTLEEHEVLAAAVMTPPFNLVVAKPRTAAALPLLADELHRRGVGLPGVSGARPEADEFAAAWRELTGIPSRRRMRLGIYRARSARGPEGVGGRMRQAAPADRELLLEWWHAFEDESLPPDAPHGSAQANVDRRLTGTGEGIVLWETDRPVCLAAFGGRTPHGVRIGPVYTPPELRRRGYASALVARLTRDLLARGRDFCFLYTDLENPTANRIYQNIGYEFIAESIDYAFDRSDRGSAGGRPGGGAAGGRAR